MTGGVTAAQAGALGAVEATWGVCCCAITGAGACAYGEEAVARMHRALRRCDGTIAEAAGAAADRAAVAAALAAVGWPGLLLACAADGRVVAQVAGPEAPA